MNSSYIDEEAPSDEDVGPPSPPSSSLYATRGASRSYEDYDDPSSSAGRPSRLRPYEDYASPSLPTAARKVVHRTYTPDGDENEEEDGTMKQASPRAAASRTSSSHNAKQATKSNGRYQLKRHRFRFEDSSSSSSDEDYSDEREKERQQRRLDQHHRVAVVDRRAQQQHHPKNNGLGIVMETPGAPQQEAAEDVNRENDNQSSRPQPQSSTPSRGAKAIHRHRQPPRDEFPDGRHRGGGNSDSDRPSGNSGQSPGRAKVIRPSLIDEDGSAKSSLEESAAPQAEDVEVVWTEEPFDEEDEAAGGGGGEVRYHETTEEEVEPTTATALSPSMAAALNASVVAKTTRAMEAALQTNDSLNDRRDNDHDDGSEEERGPSEEEDEPGRITLTLPIKKSPSDEQTTPPPDDDGPRSSSLDEQLGMGPSQGQLGQPADVGSAESASLPQLGPRGSRRGGGGGGDVPTNDDVDVDVEEEEEIWYASPPAHPQRQLRQTLPQRKRYPPTPQEATSTSAASTAERVQQLGQRRPSSERSVSPNPNDYYSDLTPSPANTPSRRRDDYDPTTTTSRAAAAAQRPSHRRDFSDLTPSPATTPRRLRPSDDYPTATSRTALAQTHFPPDSGIRPKRGVAAKAPVAAPSSVSHSLLELPPRSISITSITSRDTAAEEEEEEERNANETMRSADAENEEKQRAMNDSVLRREEEDLQPKKLLRADETTKSAAATTTTTTKEEANAAAAKMEKAAAAAPASEKGRTTRKRGSGSSPVVRTRFQFYKPEDHGTYDAVVVPERIQKEEGRGGGEAAVATTTMTSTSSNANANVKPEEKAAAAAGAFAKGEEEGREMDEAARATTTMAIATTSASTSSNNARTTKSPQKVAAYDIVRRRRREKKGANARSATDEPALVASSSKDEGAAEEGEEEEKEKEKFDGVSLGVGQRTAVSQASAGGDGRRKAIEEAEREVERKQRDLIQTQKEEEEAKALWQRLMDRSTEEEEEGQKAAAFDDGEDQVEREQQDLVSKLREEADRTKALIDQQREQMGRSTKEKEGQGGAVFDEEEAGMKWKEPDEEGSTSDAAARGATGTTGNVTRVTGIKGSDDHDDYEKEEDYPGDESLDESQNAAVATPSGATPSPSPSSPLAVAAPPTATDEKEVFVPDDDEGTDEDDDDGAVSFMPPSLMPSSSYSSSSHLRSPPAPEQHSPIAPVGSFSSTSSLSSADPDADDAAVVAAWRHRGGISSDTTEMGSIDNDGAARAAVPSLLGEEGRSRLLGDSSTSSSSSSSSSSVPSSTWSSESSSSSSEEEEEEEEKGKEEKEVSSSHLPSDEDDDDDGGVDGGVDGDAGGAAGTEAAAKATEATAMTMGERMRRQDRIHHEEEDDGDNHDDVDVIVTAARVALTTESLSAPTTSADKEKDVSSSHPPSDEDEDDGNCDGNAGDPGGTSASAKATTSTRDERIRQQNRNFHEEEDDGDDEYDDVDVIVTTARVALTTESLSATTAASAGDLGKVGYARAAADDNVDKNDDDVIVVPSSSSDGNEKGNHATSVFVDDELDDVEPKEDRVGSSSRYEEEDWANDDNEGNDRGDDESGGKVDGDGGERNKDVNDDDDGGEGYDEVDAIVSAARMALETFLRDADERQEEEQEKDKDEDRRRLSPRKLMAEKSPSAPAAASAPVSDSVLKKPKAIESSSEEESEEELHTQAGQGQGQENAAATATTIASPTTTGVGSEIGPPPSTSKLVQEEEMGVPDSPDVVERTGNNARRHHEDNDDDDDDDDDGEDRAAFASEVGIVHTSSASLSKSAAAAEEDSGEEDAPGTVLSNAKCDVAGDDRAVQYANAAASSRQSPTSATRRSPTPVALFTGNGDNDDGKGNSCDNNARRAEEVPTIRPADQSTASEGEEDIHKGTFAPVDAARSAGSRSTKRSSSSIKLDDIERMRASCSSPPPPSPPPPLLTEEEYAKNETGRSSLLQQSDDRRLQPQRKMAGTAADEQGWLSSGAAPVSEIDGSSSASSVDEVISLRNTFSSDEEEDEILSLRNSFLSDDEEDGILSLRNTFSSDEEAEGVVVSYDDDGKHLTEGGSGNVVSAVGKGVVVAGPSSTSVGQSLGGSPSVGSSSAKAVSSPPPSTPECLSHQGITQNATEMETPSKLIIPEGTATLGDNVEHVPRLKNKQEENHGMDDIGLGSNATAASSPASVASQTPDGTYLQLTIGEENQGEAQVVSPSPSLEEAVKPMEKKKKRRRGKLWREVTDEATGRKYYYNVKTRATTWEKPPGYSEEREWKKDAKEASKRSRKKNETSQQRSSGKNDDAEQPSVQPEVVAAKDSQRGGLSNRLLKAGKKSKSAKSGVDSSYAGFSTPTKDKEMGRAEAQESPETVEAKPTGGRRRASFGRRILMVGKKQPKSPQQDGSSDHSAYSMPTTDQELQVAQKPPTRSVAASEESPRTLNRRKRLFSIRKKKSKGSKADDEQSFSSASTNTQKEVPLSLEATKTPKARRWKEVTDPDTGSVYYYNVATRETTWEKPAGFDDTVDTSKAESGKSRGSPKQSERGGSKNGKSRGLRNDRKLRKLAAGRRVKAPTKSDVKGTTSSASMESSVERPQKTENSRLGEQFSAAAALRQEMERKPISKPNDQYSVPGVHAEQRKPTGKWRAIVDAATLRTYYYNVATKETLWEKPADFVEEATL